MVNNIRDKITTIKVQEKTKLRLNKLKEYKLESYEQLLRKMLFILNLCRKRPESAKRKLEQIDNSVKREKEYKLDKYEQELFNKVKPYTDNTLLHWSGYENKKEWEDDNKEPYSRKGLIISNYEDIQEEVGE